MRRRSTGGKIAVFTSMSARAAGDTSRARIPAHAHEYRNRWLAYSHAV
jgi:hypothetical protein